MTILEELKDNITMLEAETANREDVDADRKEFVEMSDDELATALKESKELVTMLETFLINI